MDSRIFSAREPSVLLVSMPWTVLGAPSLGLGLLRAVLDREGIPCTVRHLSLFMLEHLRATTYEDLSDAYGLNDFLFSGVLEPDTSHFQLRVLREKVLELLYRGKFETLRGGGCDDVVKMLLHLRTNVIPAWLDEWASRISQGPWSLVGFTCMFDQTIASAALAKLIRERAPDKMLALGGYAVRSPTAGMLVGAFPWIDAVCEGEGEATIVDLARASAGSTALDRVPGIVFRSPDGQVVRTQPAPLVDIDTVPVPNYDDFFEELEELSETYKISIAPPSLPLENSRGCWWGAKSHCTFCGIRKSDLAYRSRDAKLVLQAMKQLSTRHGVYGMQFADYILPNAYYSSLLPELVKIDRPYRIFAELKANISEERFPLLAAAGFDQLQPGIESFSSDALRKMRKGVTAAQTVYTLVMGRSHGIQIMYNLLYGFPDDDLEAYEGMASIIPHLAHLDPPITCLPVQILRWAPLQTNPEEFGIDAAEHEHSYDMIFSKEFLKRTGFELDDFCYLFDRPFENAPALCRIYERIQVDVERWRSVAKRTWLYATDDGEHLTIRDKRGEEEKRYRLDAEASRVLSSCTGIKSFAALERAHPHIPDLTRVLKELEDRGLIFVDESRIVSLLVSPRKGSMQAQPEAALHEHSH